MPLNALYGKKCATAFPRHPEIPDTSGKDGKDGKNFRLQVEAFQRVTGKMNKNRKKTHKKLAHAKKMRTFAPAITAKFLRNIEGGFGENKLKKIFKKACQK